MYPGVIEGVSDLVADSTGNQWHWATNVHRLIIARVAALMSAKIWMFLVIVCPLVSTVSSVSYSETWCLLAYYVHSICLIGMRTAQADIRLIMHQY